MKRGALLLTILQLSQPINNHCCGWAISLVVLFVTARHLSAITITKLWKQMVYYLQVLEITWGHIAKSWGERERKKTVGLGFCFYWGQGLGLGFCGGHSLLMNLKCKWGFKLWEVKNQPNKKQVAQMVSYRNQPRSLKQRGLAGWWEGRRWLAWLFSHMWLVTCLFKIALFEVGVLTVRAYTTFMNSRWSQVLISAFGT